MVNLPFEPTGPGPMAIKDVILNRLRTFPLWPKAVRRKPRLILHIGRHKSGTSSLQKFLSLNSERLKEQGIIYPQTARQQPGRQAGHLATAHHILPQEILQPGCDPEYRQRIRDALNEECKGFETVILSSEAFQNLGDPQIIRDFFAGYSIHVVAYLREYVEYIASAYSQRIHARQTSVDFETFADMFNVPLGTFFKIWSRVADQAEFALFDRAHLKNGDIVSDFLHRAGIADFQSVPLEMNPSISGNLLFFKRLANTLNLTQTDTYNAYGELAAAHRQFRGRFHIPQELQTRLRARSYNQVLRERITSEIAVRDFTIEPPIPNWIDWDQDLEIISAHPALASTALQISRPQARIIDFFKP